MDQNILSPEEQAYFDSRGQTELPKQEDPAPATEAAEADTSADDVAEVDTGDTGDVEDQPRQSMVPHKALHAEREKRKALEKELADAREFRIRMEERMKWVQEQDAAKAKASEPEPEPVPDPDEDVFAATKYALKQNEELKRQIERQQRESTEDAQRREMFTRTQAHEVEFRKATPDYDSAVMHLRSVRDKELAEVFKIADPGRRAEIIQREALQIAQSALSQGLSPAEAAYTMAKIRGYQPAVAPAVAEDGDEKLERAKAQSRSLSSVGGAPTGPMTADRLAKMSMKEFMDYERKNPDKVRALMGG